MAIDRQLDPTDEPGPGCFASVGEIDSLYQLPLRGRNGRHGQHGTSYRRPPARPGKRGANGGNATSPEDGGDANDAIIRLGFSGMDQQNLQLNGPVQVDVNIGDQGYVFMNGRGGRGGNGGDGGNGQPGSRGYRGRDATRFSRGGNGGPGGDGGNAGNATDGGNAGRGSDLRLQIDHRDLGLLMLVKGDQRSGDVGFAGTPGKPGKGGPGGPGGSSYHWTETRTYRDSEGRTRTRVVHRSNPGGFRGRAGRDGAPAFYRPVDGTEARPGRLAIDVRLPEGVVRYPSPYDLQLRTLDVASEYAILEPDSLVSADAITIVNCGGMPTPDNFVVRIFLDRDRWILPDEVDLVLVKSLQPGESFTFQNAGLRFRLGDYDVDRPRRQPFTLDHQVNPHCRMESGICRPFRQFENGEDIEVRFPIELTEIEALGSLTPGESTWVRVGITNVSDETFDNQYLYRAVKSQMRLLSGDLAFENIAFFDPTDQSFDLMSTDLTCPIGDLRPGQTHQIQTRIGIREDADIVPYQAFRFGIDLHLQRPKSSPRHDEFRCVDYRNWQIRVAEPYRRDDGSRFLLIANRNTDVNDIDRWTQLADYFGSGLDVWDVSYYGFFDLVRRVQQDRSLLDHWRGMTIIIPNDHFRTAAGRTVSFNELSRSQFLKAAADFDINFYIVGDSKTGGEAMLASAMVPLDEFKSDQQLTDQKQFLKAVKRWGKYVARSGDVSQAVASDASEIADQAMGAVHRFDVSKRTFLFQPDQAWLTKQAERLQQRLRKIDPLHRWVIVHRYDTGDTDTNWGFFRHRQVGTLEARRTLDSTKGSVVLYEVDPIDLVDPEFITSNANKHGIFLALKFEDKVDRFIRVVSERVFPRYREDYIDRPLTDEEVQQIGQELLDSIMVDLYNEQLTARNSRVWGPLGVASLTPKLNYLAERSLNYGVTYRQMQENETTLRLLYDLIANLRYMAIESRTVWDLPIFPTAFLKRSRAVSAHMLDRVDRITSAIFGPKLSWWDRWTSASDDYNAFGGAKKKVPKGLARDTADEKILQIETRLRNERTKLSKYTVAQSHDGLTYDPEVLLEKQRVMSGKQFDALVQAEKQAELRRARTEYEVAEQRNELLVPLETAEVTATRQAKSKPTPMGGSL
ncbi:DUF7932 domain-containing protein [Crateriforma conspicua]|uniref:DUF7932 domain-containing protein n=1 Tax=Crateriforma conspicua TaxID=2527996 RepID=UPI00118C96DA|nr:hypothetical protein [Crateriforma conspicua]QDV65612.1 hypothetical protein Mal65_47850 [Crateriforma conspicua]